MPYKDPEKRRENRRKWYYNNRKSEIAHVARRRGEIKKWFLEYKSKLKCAKCGENDPVTLDFHHEKDKDKGIHFMSHWGYSKERIKKEIEKCIVLCANCHRKLHHSIREKQNSLKLQHS